MIETESGFRAWSLTGSAESSGGTTEPVSYAGTDLASLAGRAATAAADWGGVGPGCITPAKTASSVEGLWKDGDTHPVVLLLLILDRYKEESLEWDPDVLRVTTMRDGLQISGANWEKILAMRCLMMSPSPWRQWEVFHWVSRGLAGIPPNFTYLEQPDLGHYLVAADIMKIVDPKRDCSEEVDKFVATALREDGQVYSPFVFPLLDVQRELEDRKLECESCHALHRDDNDTKCVTCGSTKLRRVPYVFNDLKLACGTLFESRSASPVASAQDELPDDAQGNLVYHLLGYWDYARRMRHNLLQQLRALSR